MDEKKSAENNDLDYRATMGHFICEDVLQDLNGESYTNISFQINKCFGDIYRVRKGDQDKLLVWYHVDEKHRYLYQKLCDDVKNGPPSKMFIWPESVIKYNESSFGYILPICNLASLANFIKFGSDPRSLRNLLTACRDVVIAFRELHTRGLCLQNLDDDDFLFDKDTGHLTVTNYENIATDNTLSEYLIKRPFAAPEIVEGDNHVGINSDSFIMALILFRILTAGHPFEGSKTAKFPIQTLDVAKFIYGYRAVFIFDSANDSNRPVKGAQDIVVNRWNNLPDKLKELFCKSFSEEAIKNPHLRPAEAQWFSAFEDFFE